MSKSVEIFLADRPDLAAVLEPLGWHKGGEGSTYVLDGPSWLATVWNASPMSREDAPPGVRKLQPDIAWHISAGVEGSNGGTKPFDRAVRTLARAGHGVMADGAHAWSVTGRRLLRGMPMSSETEYLKMMWWTADPRTRTEAGARALLGALERFVPQAIPRRWGHFEPPNKSVEQDGLDDLAREIAGLTAPALGITVFVTAVQPPFSAFDVRLVGCLGERQPWEYGVRSLTIEVGASVLAQPGWGRQLSRGFRAVSMEMRPFYAEARIERRVKWDPHRGGRLGSQPPPLAEQNWFGFPRIAPLAMVVGPPYTPYWVGQGGVRDGEFIFYLGEVWPEPPVGGIPVAAEPLLQEHDISIGRRPPNEVPAVWPFPH